jgi:hypothetical protein
MQGSTRHRSADGPAQTGINAAVWIGRGRALVIRGSDDGHLESMELAVPDLPAITPPALAEIAHSIGVVDRVLVIGRDDLRTALEREIVAIGHRPETIREADLDGPPDEAILISRLAALR